MSDLFEQAGGMDGLRAVLRTFYDRVFSDIMIGFLFKGADKERLIEKEAEFAARALGATQVAYTGQTIAKAHAKHPILGGHFDRRLQLLREAWQAHDVPEAVRGAWEAHTHALRAQVTADAGSECDHDAARARLSIADDD